EVSPARGQRGTQLQEGLGQPTEPAKQPHPRVCDQNRQVLELRATLAGHTDTSGQDEAALTTKERVPLATLLRAATKAESVKAWGDYVQKAFGRACDNFRAARNLHLRAETVVRRAWKRPVGDAIRPKARAHGSTIVLSGPGIVGIHSPERIETPTALMEISADLDGAPAAVPFRPVVSVVKSPGYWSTLLSNWKARDVTGADAVGVVPAARRHLRRVAMAACGGLA